MVASVIQCAVDWTEACIQECKPRLQDIMSTQLEVVATANVIMLKNTSSSLQLAFDKLDDSATLDHIEKSLLKLPAAFIDMLYNSFRKHIHVH